MGTVLDHDPELEKALDSAKDEVKKHLHELLPQALKLAVKRLQGNWVDTYADLPETISDLDSALARAERLEQKLAGELADREEAADLAKRLLRKAVEVASILAAFKGA